MTRRTAVLALAALLLFCLSCARLPENVTPRPAPGRNAQQVDYVTQVQSSDEWAHTQWYRIGDPYETVGFFVVSEIGSICLAQDGGWVFAHHGDLFECAGGWRSKSNSVGTLGARVPGR